MFYEIFKKKYDELIKDNLTHNINYEPIIEEITKTVNSCKGKEDISKKIPILISMIFALWTIMRGESYFDSDSQDEKNYLL